MMLISPYRFAHPAGGLTPPAVGAHWEAQGGWYAGVYTLGGAGYHLIVADAADDVVRQWKTSNTDTAGTTNQNDGQANTAAIVTAGIAAHPAAQYCVDYTGGGFDDWYMGAPQEWQTIRNRLWHTVPGVPDAFSASGSQRFSLYLTTGFYETSATASAGAQTVMRMDTNQLLASASKTNSYRIRPLRRVAV